LRGLAPRKPVDKDKRGDGRHDEDVDVRAPQGHGKGHPEGDLEDDDARGRKEGDGWAEKDPREGDEEHTTGTPTHVEYDLTPEPEVGYDRREYEYTRTHAHESRRPSRDEIPSGSHSREYESERHTE
jgi:hypothetical protein